MPFRTNTFVRSAVGWSPLLPPDPARQRVTIIPTADIYVSERDPGLSPLAQLEAGRLDGGEAAAFRCTGPLWVRPAAGVVRIAVVEEVRTLGRS